MPPSDHDILIEVKTILSGVVEDFRAYRKASHEESTSLSRRIGAMELNKVSIAEYVQNKRDQDIRLSRLEKGYWVAIGVVALLQFVAPMLVNKLFP